MYAPAERSPAALLRAARRASGLTQAELAHRLNISQASIARLEQRGSNPTLATLGRALGATGHRLGLVATPAPANVDETLIARQLRLSPAQRLRSFQAAHRALAPLVGAARHRDTNGSARNGG